MVTKLEALVVNMRVRNLHVKILIYVFFFNKICTNRTLFPLIRTYFLLQVAYCLLFDPVLRDWRFKILFFIVHISTYCPLFTDFDDKLYDFVKYCISPHPAVISISRMLCIWRRD